MTNPNPFDQQKPIAGVKKILAIASGKGGVGKSSVATNLAVALAQEEKSVGLLDADIYGPSLPRMFGALNQAPQVNSTNRIQPLERYGVRFISMGNLVDENSAIVWRGPMLFKALNQFFFEVDWGELDYLLIDLPPGTGDIQLSLAQKVPVTAALTVCTPQNVALADVKKSIDMFERIGVPLLGVVENMAYMVHPDKPDEKLEFFPKGELHSYLDNKRVPLLGEIPMDPKLALACESGIPLVSTDVSSPTAQTFKKIAQKVLQL